MFKPTKLLKVMSIILIVLGALSLIFIGIGVLTFPTTMKQFQDTGMDTKALEQSMLPLNLVISITTSLAQIAIAILALKGKMRKIVMVGGLGLVLYSIYGLVTVFTMGSDFQVFAVIMSLIGLLIPLLFLWGAYQSDEV